MTRVFYYRSRYSAWAFGRPRERVFWLTRVVETTFTPKELTGSECEWIVPTTLDPYEE
jgi:hypothetical protein